MLIIYDLWLFYNQFDFDFALAFPFFPPFSTPQHNFDSMLMFCMSMSITWQSGGLEARRASQRHLGPYCLLRRSKGTNWKDEQHPASSIQFTWPGHHVVLSMNIFSPRMQMRTKRWPQLNAKTRTDKTNNLIHWLWTQLNERVERKLLLFAICQQFEYENTQNVNLRKQRAAQMAGEWKRTEYLLADWLMIINK